MPPTTTAVCKALMAILSAGAISELVYQLYLLMRRREVGEPGTEVLFFPDARVACRAHFVEEYGCPASSPLSPAACRFAHGDSSLGSIYRHLAAARRTMDVCVFTITCQDLAEVLVRMFRRGVLVRVVTDDQQGLSPDSQIWKLRSEGIIVRTDSSSFHMHHKFVIIDRKQLLNGSFNWTRQAINGNKENVFITDEHAVVQQYANEFQKLWMQLDPNPES